MTAKIDIKTPAGNSLEGFPYLSNAPKVDLNQVLGDLFDSCNERLFPNPVLSPGDIITIEVL